MKNVDSHGLTDFVCFEIGQRFKSGLWSDEQSLTVVRNQPSHKTETEDRINFLMNNTRFCITSSSQTILYH